MNYVVGEWKDLGDDINQLIQFMMERRGPRACPIIKTGDSITRRKKIQFKKADVFSKTSL